MINAFGSDISDKGLARLTDLSKLEYLNLHGCRQVTGAGLRSLAACRALRILNVDGAMLKQGKYSLSDLKALRQAAPKLTITRDDAAPIPELSRKGD